MGIKEDALKRKSSDPLDDESSPDRKRLALGLFNKDFLSAGGGGGNGGAPVFVNGGSFDADLVAVFVDFAGGVGRAGADADAGAGAGAGAGCCCCWGSLEMSGTLSIEVLDLLVLLSNS